MTIQQYNSIDAMKFFMAICVIGIHASAITTVPFSFFEQFIVDLAVPFFFIASGFFLFQKIRHSSSELSSSGTKNILNSYLKKSIRLYAIWTAVYLPLAIKSYLTNTNPWYIDCMSFVRGFLFIGENPFSWPLWYLLALIVAVFLIKVLFNWKLPIQSVFAIGFALMGLGWAYDQLDTDTLSGICLFLSNSYDTVFGTTRNGIFIGLACVSMGMMISYYLHKKRSSLIFNIISILGGGILAYFNFPFSSLLAASGLFCLTLQLRSDKLSSLCLFLRSMSTLMYFTHMIFIYSIKQLMDKQALQLSLHEAWFAAFMLTFLFSVFVYKLSQTKKGKWIRFFL